MASALQEYLKRYTSDSDKPKKKKKKAKAPNPSHGGAVTIVDADPVWQKEVREESPDTEDDQEDAPLVIKDVEVKRMQRLEALKMHRPYISTADDGSGWVSVDNIPERGSPEKSIEFAESPRKSRHGTPDSSLARNAQQDRTDLPPSRKVDSPLQEPSSGKQRYDSPNLSPPRRKHPRQTETSPRKSRHDTPDLSPSRHDTQHDGADLSSPRKRETASRKSRHDTPDLSPQRKDGSADFSPPRKRLTSLRRDRHDSPDLSPPRKDGGPDLSPPRKRQTSLRKSRHDIADLSPPRKDGSADLSPPRKRQTSSRQSLRELSSPRTGGSPDLSPPRKRQTSSRMARHETPDASLLKKNGSPDLSPPRKTYHDSLDLRTSQEFRKRQHMADGTGAGLQSGRQLAKEIDIKKREDSRRFKELDMSISGRRANTVYRDKHGKRLESLDELLKLQQAEKPPKEEKPLEWGKGLVQKREAEARHEEIEAEKLKPFARTRDDPDLDKLLKEEVRWGDPMAHLVKKKIGEPVLIDLGASEQMKESGFIVPQAIPQHSWLKRGITPPPNRYGIKPGRHWDGVDRSTGFERDMYKRQNEKKADELEAYLWSVADM